MRGAPVLLGLVLGLGAIFYAWSRGTVTSAVAGREPSRTSGASSRAASEAHRARSGGGDRQAVAPGGNGDPAARLPAQGSGAPGAAEPMTTAAPAHQAKLPEGGPADDVAALRARGLLIPVEGLQPGDLRDDFAEARAGGAHEAIDMLAPRGTRVLAADDGFVARLFTSVRGGLTVYQFDPGQTWCYYYAHLDSYAPGLREGQVLRKGDLVGFVGTSGNAPPGTPHLHFAIFKLGSEKHWWQGTAVNPFPVWAERTR